MKIFADQHTISKWYCKATAPAATKEAQRQICIHVSAQSANETISCPKSQNTIPVAQDTRLMMRCKCIVWYVEVDYNVDRPEFSNNLNST